VCAFVVCLLFLLNSYMWWRDVNLYKSPCHLRAYMYVICIDALSHNPFWTLLCQK
jgi:hypothetical protein